MSRIKYLSIRSFSFLYCGIMAIILLSCENGDGQISLKPFDFEEKMKSQPGILLDIRTPEEFKVSHLPKATNLNFYALNFGEELDKLDTSKTYYIYCERGGRTKKALETFQRKGFRHVYELKGGLDLWQKEDMALESGNGTTFAEITDEEYQKMINSHSLVVIDFSAKWCGPCRKLSPLLEEIGKKRSKDLHVHLIDVDANEDISLKNDIESLPTLAWYKNGKLVNRTIGIKSEKELNGLIDQLLK